MKSISHQGNLLHNSNKQRATFSLEIHMADLGLDTYSNVPYRWGTPKENGISESKSAVNI